VVVAAVSYSLFLDCRLSLHHHHRLFVF
jgi:hypothetical protein